jgi:mono/diheme cytochrome c family protein
VAWAAGTLVQEAPAGRTHLGNPLEGNEGARRAGSKLYLRHCAACHGAKRQGGRKAPPLDQAEVHQASPEVLFWILRNGSLRTGMPSFAHLPEPERWQIITFLRTRAAPAGMPQ